MNAETNNIYAITTYLFVVPCVHPSVLMSILAFLHDGFMDFLHIGYHDQVPWAADACKTEFGSVLNMSNYGIFFINFDCLL